MDRQLQNGTVFDSKHEPHCTDVLWINENLDPHSHPDVVPPAGKDLSTHRGPAIGETVALVQAEQNGHAYKPSWELTRSPEASCKGTPHIAVH